MQSRFRRSMILLSFIGKGSFWSCISSLQAKACAVIAVGHRGLIVGPAIDRGSELDDNRRDERHDLAGRRREGQRASRGVGEVIVTARAVINAITPTG